MVIPEPVEGSDMKKRLMVVSTGSTTDKVFARIFEN